MQRFSDLRVWKRSYALVVDVYKLTASLPETERFGLSAQLRRAAISTVANIAEGSKRQNRRDYGRFLNISQGSLAEIECLLMLCCDLGFVDRNAAHRALHESDEVARMLSSLRTAVLRRPSTPNS